MTSLLSFLQQRGCLHDVSGFDELERELEAGPISFYCGFDPTADSLHVGHMLPLLIMRHFQKRGHRPIVLLGAATGMIGDPSGKSEERKLLDEETLRHNVSQLEAQVKRFLSGAGIGAYTIVRNDDWLRPVTFLEFLRDIGKHFSVNTMLAKESVKGRLENREQGISYTEFSYMLLQAYDFYWLYKHHGCRLQVGGSDQWGNITAGLELIRRKAAPGESPAYGATFPLLTTASGTKFGKTEQGAVWLDAAKTSPYRFYQYFYNTQDADALRYLKLFTDAADDELADLEQQISERPEARGAQEFLARHLTALVHGEAEAARAAAASRVLFGEWPKNGDSQLFAEVFADVPTTTLAKSELGEGLAIEELLVRCGIAPSKGAARRLITGGGLYLNNERLSESGARISAADFIDSTLLVIRTGKRNYHIVRLQS